MCGWNHSPWVLCHELWPDSPPAHVSQAGNMPVSGNLNTPEPCSSSGAESGYRPVPHDAEVTARIDAIIREHQCQVSVPEDVTLTNCGEVIRDYFGAAAAVDSDDWRGYGEESHPAPAETSSCPNCDRTDPDVIHLGDLMPGCDCEHIDSYADCASDATIPLAEQIRRYGEMAEAVLDALHDNLEDERFRTAIIRLGAQRLIEGHELYGSTMYGWDANKRDDEMFCEAADYVVYGSSAPFFDVGATHTNTPDVSEQP